MHVACVLGLAQTLLSYVPSTIASARRCAAETRLRCRAALQVVLAWPKQAEVWVESSSMGQARPKSVLDKFNNSCAPLFGRFVYVA